MVKIAVTRGNNREKNIIGALDLLKDDIEKSIENKKSDTLFIKVNTTNINFPDVCTHPSAVETVVDYFSGRFKKVWFGKKANEVRKRIKNKECCCPLANVSYTNMLCNWKTLFKVIWKII